MGLHKLPSFVLRVFGLYIATTVACVVLIAPFIDYSCGRFDIVSYGVPLFLLSLLACGLIVVLFSYMRDKSVRPKLFYALVFGIGIALFVVQLYIEKSAGFITGWDVGVLSQVGDRAPADLSSLSRYFSIYPNQIFLYGLFYKIGKLALLFGLSSYRALVCCGCLCVTLSIVLTTFVCRRLFGDARALIFQVLASLFLGINGWILVPYSDSYGMLFTCVALWFYVIPRRRSLRLFGTTAVSLLGYMVKPTAVFLLFAVMCLDWIPRMVCALRSWRSGGRAAERGCVCAASSEDAVSAAGDGDADVSPERRAPQSGTSVSAPLRRTFVRAIWVVAPILFGAILAMGVGHYVEGNYFTIDEDASRGITHFLAMGINPERKGVYSAEENQLSDSIADPAERRAAQLALWKEHLSELGPVGVLKIWFQKNLTNYADGTFAWGAEGGFVQQITGDSTDVRSWLGIVETSTSTGPNTAYGWYCQILWVAALLGCAASTLRRARGLRGLEARGLLGAERATSRTCVVIALTLIFLSGFLLIFECRARYLFLFSPFYVLLAIDGLIGTCSMGELLARKFTALREELGA